MYRLLNKVIDEVYIRSKEASKLLAGAREKGEMFRERLLLVKQRLLRNENFCPPTMRMTDSANFIRVSTEEIEVRRVGALIMFVIDHTDKGIDWS